MFIVNYYDNVVKELEMIAHALNDLKGHETLNKIELIEVI